MEHPTPFAEMPATPDSLITQVREALAHEVAARPLAPPVDLERLAVEAVWSLWDRPVKAFIPILAFRQAYDALPPAHPSDVLVEDRSR